MHLPSTIVVCAISIAGAACILAGDLAPQEARGKQIFVHGSSVSKITATLGGDAGELPGETLPCANCHGLDGRGKPEGGVVPSNIRWSELAKPYTVEHQDGRKHPPYTPQSLKRAITLGLDPAGNVLSPVMPRYRMSWQDLADLVSYIQRIETDLDAGLSSTSLRIGVVLPPATMPAVGDAIRTAIESFAAEMNAGGGVFGRSIELRFANAPTNPASQPDELRKFIVEERLFALCASYVVHAEQADSMVLEQERVPLIGALGLLPYVPSAANTHVFYLDAGVPAEIDALVTWAAQTAGNGTKAVILGTGDPLVDEPAEASFRKHGWTSVEFWSGDAGDSTVVLCLNGEAGFRTLRESRVSSKPLILVPGALDAASVIDLPGADEGRVALAFSWVPGEWASASIKLRADHKRAQLFALASMRVLLKGLENSGQDLSREKLLQSIEGLYQFQTGITPPLTFGPNRRIGTYTARVFLVSPRTHGMIPVN